MRTAVTVTLAAFAWLTAAPAARAESPVGDWRLQIQGHSQTLVIRSVGPDGRLEGAYCGLALAGKWNAATQTLTFATADQTNWMYTFEGRLRRQSCGRTVTCVLEGSYNLNTFCYPVDPEYRFWFAWSAQRIEEGPRGR
jgi:hypothetical protein